MQTHKNRLADRRESPVSELVLYEVQLTVGKRRATKPDGVRLADVRKSPSVTCAEWSFSRRD